MRLTISLRVPHLFAFLAKTGAPTFWSVLILLATSLVAQTSAPPAPENYSGMYTFLQEGEFVQVTVEDAGRVTGFVSRYENTDGDHSAFLDQFFKAGKLDGNKLNFS